MNNYFFVALVLILGLANGKYFLVELDGEKETEASPKKLCNPLECRLNRRFIGKKEKAG
jgi:hypothetical protein